jgi:transposase-like protein/IS1 family transposase
VFVMTQTKPLSLPCPHCGTSADNVKYHSRYSSRDGNRLVFRCTLCRKTFCDRFGTAFYDLKTPEEKVLRSVHEVLEGLGYEAVARIEQVHPTSLHRWLQRACVQAQQADHQILQNLAPEVIEMDELHSFAGTKQRSPERDDDAVGKHWTHCSMARESRLLVEVEVGPRTQSTAEKLVKNTANRLVSDHWPLWCSDGWEPYVGALLSLFHLVIHYLRSRGRGRPRLPQRIAHPKLRYGQVVKQRSGRKLLGITRRVIYGVAELVPLSKISTSLLERLNGTLRLHVSPMRRKTRAFAKCRETLNMHVQLFKSYYNLCLIHSSLKAQTPAQAAGLTNHQWSVRELLTFGASNISKIT